VILRTEWLLPLLLLAACATPADKDRPDDESTAPSTTNQLLTSGHDVHALMLIEFGPLATGSLARDGVQTLPPMSSPFPFNELVPSWNVELPEGAGFRAELRVGRDDGSWSSWYDLGTWGVAPDGVPGPVRDLHGVVDVDVFRSEQVFDAVQARFALRDTDEGELPRLRRVALCVSNTTGDSGLAADHAKRPDPVSPESWQRRLDVPFRSQRSEDPAIAGRICSPTSVSMVMAYHGVERQTSYVAGRAYDAEHDLYGGWSRAVQAAFEEGVPGYVTRFGSWGEVRAEIAEGRPVIASIRAREGELRGAPYESTGGHLIVITGFDAEGDVLVNDPAASNRAEGIVKYAREDMQRVWLDRGGVAYVLQPPER